MNSVLALLLTIVLASALLTLSLGAIGANVGFLPVLGLVASARLVYVSTTGGF